MFNRVLYTLLNNTLVFTDLFIIPADHIKVLKMKNTCTFMIFKSYGSNNLMGISDHEVVLNTFEKENSKCL